MTKIVVLGTGLVGKAMILDLYKSYNITAVDISLKNLSDLEKLPNVTTIAIDLSVSSNIKKVIKDADLVIGAVPGFMGFNMVKNVIEAGKNIVDISFFPEDPLELDKSAKENGVTAIVDCGVSPGMGNIILGHYLNKIDISSYKCLVGGLPQKPEKPWGYKAVFSPIDVIEIYTRPVRYRKNMKIIIDKALSKCETIEFKNIGKFEAWYTDGLRTLLDTTTIPNIIELTIRHMGTIEPIIALRDSGFFSSEEIDLKGKKVKPIDLTTNLMFSQWKMKPNDHDMTLMRIIIEGTKDGKEQKVEYDLVDYYDEKTETTSMARTTGYTCTATANLLLENKFNRIGIIPPEILGQDEIAWNYILKYLADRNVVYNKLI
ncbi:MAG: saccharopine dehydrogenase [Planctomycetia bacterium]|nr:saccharopine dehydrogenase [Planctomycetia bacterium]